VDIRILAAIPAFAPSAFCQPLVECSAKIGIPISDAFQTGSYQFLATGLHEGHSATRRYTAGAGLILRLPHGFGAEVDALYKRLGYDLTSTNPEIPVIDEHTWTTANSWEFPLLVVYRPPRLLHIGPRLSAGVSFRAVTGEGTTGQCSPSSNQYAAFCPVTAPTPQTNDGHLTTRSSFGGAFGAGIETRAGRVRLKPEIRYTRWRADAGDTGPVFDLRSNPNQIDFLLGIGF
jgi:hypothetical protein